jgi:uncharacterized repeat protein (TIGR03803 family)
MKAVLPLTSSHAVFFVFALTFTASALAEQVLHSFSTQDGTPGSELVADKKGNLYGTTRSGGANGVGSVFELTPPLTAGQAWTETVIYSFPNLAGEPVNPGGDLAIDSKGNLYGYSGIGSSPAFAVFQLTPPKSAGGAWTQSILSSSLFSSGFSKIRFDQAGNLYGVTLLTSACSPGTANGACGSVFELVRPTTSSGTWTYTTLYNFGAFADDATEPAGITLWNGAIYGVSYVGGAPQKGTVFQLVQQNGSWTENILYSFNGDEGSLPDGALVYDSAGNFYGVTRTGGGCPKFNGDCGAIFELSPPTIPGDPWQETTLYRFSGGPDGMGPWGGLVFDQFGNLYGTAEIGGPKTKLSNNNGTVFKLGVPAVAGDPWTFKVLHAFAGMPSGDGSQPFTDLLLFKGKLYGTTYQGGSANLGTVFALVP